MEVAPATVICEICGLDFGLQGLAAHRYWRHIRPASQSVTDMGQS